MNKPMLTNEERDIVVEAMRKYPAGVSRKSWGSSEEFFQDGDSKWSHQVEELPEEILLEHG